MSWLSRRCARCAIDAALPAVFPRKIGSSTLARILHGIATMSVFRLGFQPRALLHLVPLACLLSGCGGSSSGSPAGDAGTGGATAGTTSGSASGGAVGSDSADASSGTSMGGAGSTTTGSGANGNTTGSGGNGASSGASTDGEAGGSGGSGASGSGGSAGEGGAGGTEVQCCGGDATYFPVFDRSCSTPSDCVLVQHVTSCCGSVLIEAIAAGEQSAFADAEAICDGQYPPCGCAANGVDVEDGTLLPYGSEDQVEARCDDGTCQAHYTGTTFACESRLCIEGQVCQITTSSSDGTESDQCYPASCDDCSCVNQTDCVCDSTGGQTTVHCTVP